MYGILDLTWDPRKSAAPAANQGPAMVRGDTYRLPLTFSTTDGITVTPLPITGTVAAQLRVAPLDDSALGYVAPFKSFVTTLASNLVTISLAPADSFDLPDDLYWDIQQLDGADVFTLLAGKVKVLGDVTRLDD